MNNTITNFISSSTKEEASNVTDVNSYAKGRTNITGNNCIVIYNPYCHEALMAAAILKSHFDGEHAFKEASVRIAATSHNEAIRRSLQNPYRRARFVSMEEIIDNDGASYIWIGVKQLAPTSGRSYSSASKHYKYGYNQPYYTEKKKLSIIEKLMGKKEISDLRQRDNDLIEYMNGPIDHTLEWQQFVHVTLADKVLFDFNIEREATSFGHHNYLAPGWENGTLEPLEEAGYYRTLCNALEALECDDTVMVSRGSMRVSEWMNEEKALRYRLLTNKAANYRVETMQGASNLSIVALPPALFHLATRHFLQIGNKFFAMSSGMNGRFYYGNTVVKNMTMFGEKINFIDR